MGHMGNYTPVSAARMSLLVGVVVIYAVLSAYAAASGNSVLAVCAFVTLLGVLLWPALLSASRVAWLAWVGCTLALATTLWLGIVSQTFELVPVLVNAGIAWLFGRTLLPGREALINTMVRLIEGEDRLDQPGIRIYTVRLTLVWAVVMGVQAALLLVIWWLLHVTHTIDSGTITHAWLRFGNYAVIGVLFVLEYGWRRISLRNVEHLGFWQTMTRIARCWPEIVQGRHK